MIAITSLLRAIEVEENAEVKPFSSVTDRKDVGVYEHRGPLK